MLFLIADDHTLFADTLEILLKRSFGDDVQVVHAITVDQVQEILSTSPQPDLLFLDFRMPGMNHFAGLKKIRETYPQMRVALMSGLAEDEDIEKALALGIRAYFPKTMSKAALFSSIKLVLQGHKFVPLSVDASDKKYYPSQNYDETSCKKESCIISDQDETVLKIAALSKREKEILQGLLQGKSNMQISESYGIQVSTVKIHVRNICQKMNAKNRTQAALMAQSVDFKP